MSLPGFNAADALYLASKQYACAGRVLSREKRVEAQFLACAAYAVLCLAATEDPVAAGWCWWDFARRCGGATA